MKTHEVTVCAYRDGERDTPIAKQLCNSFIVMHASSREMALDAVNEYISNSFGLRDDIEITFVAGVMVHKK